MAIWLSISASGALLHPPQPPQLDRRSAVLAAASACLLPLSTLPLPAAAISATTMAGKSKAELGCILVEAPQQDGNPCRRSSCSTAAKSPTSYEPMAAR